MSRLADVLTRRPGWLLAAVALLAHLYGSGGYGYFRDELYFIVCGERLDWGYVDQPPLIPLIAAAMHRLFAPSLVMLRLVPALAYAATVALTAECARFLGGGRWAQGMAGLATLCPTRPASRSGSAVAASRPSMRIGRASSTTVSGRWIRTAARSPPP